MYTRKTKDEYQIHGNYGYGFEEVTAEETYKEAKAQLACYRANEPQAVFRIIRRRVKL